MKRTLDRQLHVFLLSIALLLQPSSAEQKLLPATPPKPQTGSQALARLVDPFIGVRGEGLTLPGTSLPNGSVHPSPETLKSRPNGYHPDEPITGFSQLHAQGANGTTSYGTFLLSPQVGPLEIDEAKHGSPRGIERAGADQYSVELSRYGTKVDFTPAHFSTIYRITYPTSNEAQLLFDITRKIGGVVASGASEVKIDPETGTITGRVLTKKYWIPTPFDIWFCAKVSQKPTASGIFQGDQIVAAQTSAQAGDGERLGAWLTFATKDETPIYVKLAVSFHSAARAAEWLDREIPAWDYEAVRAAAESRWNAALSSIQIEGATDAERVRFYTSLYHSRIQPRDRTGDNSVWNAGEPFWDDHYTLWDTYRTLFPLMVLLHPSQAAGNIRSFIQAYEKLGAMDTAFIGGKNFRVGQGGDEVDNVIADAFVKELPGVDWLKAYSLLQFNAEHRRSSRYLAQGWFSTGDPSEDDEPKYTRARSGSSTLGFSQNDGNVANVALGLGKTDDAEKYRARSNNWRNVWDPTATSDGFTGFIMPRNAEGQLQPIDPKFGSEGKRYVKNLGFYEGTSWVYSYGILHDLEGMIAAMGGRARFVERLEHALENDLINLRNEPSFATAWLFSSVGRPDLSSKWARTILGYFAEGYPGDEDAGAMSSHYIWNVMGLFPLSGHPIYYLHGPRYPRTTLQLEDGKKFVIDAPEASLANFYIQSALLNGQPLEHPWLTHRQIIAGGTLQLVMGPTPSQWLRTEP